MKNPHDIIEGREHHDAHEDADAHFLRDVNGLNRDLPAYDQLYSGEEYVAAVEDGYGKQVYNAQVDADQGKEEKKTALSCLCPFTRLLEDQ
jgi:hypothetical protein